jgi:hypothetical protein
LKGIIQGKIERISHMNDDRAKNKKKKNLNVASEPRQRGQDFLGMDT